MNNFSQEQNKNVEKKRAAFLIGSAPEDKIQPKIKEMASFLQTPQGGNYQDNEILLLANGTDEKTLKRLLEFFGGDKMLFYICTTYVTEGWEQKVWISENEIDKSNFEKNENLGITDVQLIYDVDRDFVDYDYNDNFLNNSEDFFFATSGNLRRVK